MVVVPKIKIVVVFVVLLLLTGCTINYDLTINENSIDEKISGSVNKSEYQLNDEDTSPNLFYTLINSDVPALVVGDDLYKKYISELEDKLNYNYSYTYNNNFDKSRIINSCFENHIISETDKYYYIELSGKFYCLYSDKININVTSNYEVIDNNADKINGNKYVWTIDNSNDVDILLTISKEEKYEEPVKAKMFSTFQIVGLIVFALLTIITYILYKRKNSGKI